MECVIIVKKKKEMIAQSPPSQKKEAQHFKFRTVMNAPQTQQQQQQQQQPNRKLTRFATVKLTLSSETLGSELKKSRENNSAGAPDTKSLGGSTSFAELQQNETLLCSLAKPCSTPELSNRERLHHVYNGMKKQKTMLDIDSTQRNRSVIRQMSTTNVQSKVPTTPKTLTSPREETNKWTNWNDEAISTMAKKISESLFVKMNNDKTSPRPRNSRLKTTEVYTGDDEDEDDEENLDDDDRLNQEEKANDGSAEKVQDVNSADTFSKQVLAELMNIKQLVQSKTDQLFGRLDQPLSISTNKPQITDGEELWKKVDKRFEELKKHITTDLHSTFEQTNDLLRHHDRPADENTATTPPQFWWEWW
ncbi:hypothetical protein RFI_32324 [Reticulomyxa filosa]|uniref:Uncharacterized protein n=1 Tax=Reticulomyxa filosa TaxID=46433 RepID=X6LT17_RETFI|nr:hypothetical protein RFI_32324 [Reticulomyxa filosa]|eukprot:ETO05068.1 hypothetical protein RFI_32324 [Reticulomyxa filosa]